MEDDREQALLLRLAVRHGHIVELLSDGSHRVKTGLLDAPEPANAGDGCHRATTPKEAANLAAAAWLRFPRPDAMTLISEAVGAGSYATVLVRGAQVTRVVLQPTRATWLRRVGRAAWAELTGDA